MCTGSSWIHRLLVGRASVVRQVEWRALHTFEELKPSRQVVLSISVATRRVLWRGQHSRSEMSFMLSGALRRLVGGRGMSGFASVGASPLALFLLRASIASPRP